jgi:hypothetical protein
MERVNSVMQVAKKNLYGVLITLAGTLFVYSYPGVFVTIYRYLVPVTVTIIVPDGYRGPIAIIQASEDKDTEGARNPYEIVIPPNGIAKSWIPGILPREYYSFAKY